MKKAISIIISVSLFFSMGSCSKNISVVFYSIAGEKFSEFHGNGVFSGEYTSYAKSAYDEAVSVLMTEYDFPFGKAKNKLNDGCVIVTYLEELIEKTM